MVKKRGFVTSCPGMALGTNKDAENPPFVDHFPVGSTVPSLVGEVLQPLPAGLCSHHPVALGMRCHLRVERTKLCQKGKMDHL